MKAKILTPEQKIIGDMQRLQASKGWKYIIDAMQSDKERLINQLVYEFHWLDTEKKYSESDLWRNKIKLIEDIILMPQKIKEEYEPIIETNSLDI